MFSASNVFLFGDAAVETRFTELFRWNEDISVGFRTSFQVLASICFFTGFVAVLSVSSKRDHGKSTNGRPWLYLDGLFDTNFVLTTVGNMIIAFSKYKVL